MIFFLLNFSLHGTHQSPVTWFGNYVVLMNVKQHAESVLNLEKKEKYARNHLF
jgi:hypothetical protein